METLRTCWRTTQTERCCTTSISIKEEKMEQVALNNVRLVYLVWDDPQLKRYFYGTEACNRLPSILVVGPLGCGKTAFTEKLLLENPQLFQPLPHKCITVMELGKTDFNLCKIVVSRFTKVFPITKPWSNGFLKGEGFWCWMIWWTKGATISACWIYLANVHIKTSRSPTCAKTLAFSAMPITSWRSRTLGINWEYVMFSFNRFLPRGRTVWKPFIMPPRALMGFWSWTYILPPPIKNVCWVLLKHEGWTRYYQKRRDQTRDGHERKK